MNKLVMLASVTGLMFGNICPPCLTPAPPAIPNCQILKPTTPSGIVGVIGVKCNYVFTNEADPAEWITAVASGDVVGRIAPNWIKGTMPKGAPNELALGAVGMGEVTSYDHTATLVDSLADTQDLHHAFYDHIASHSKTYNWRIVFSDESYIQCTNPSFSRSYQGGENEKEVASIEAMFKWRTSPFASTAPKYFSFGLSQLPFTIG